MVELRIFSSDAFDRIAGLLVDTQPATMANVSLYDWFAKAATYDLAQLRAFQADLREYIRTAQPPASLVDLTRDFPNMFDWFGQDIVHSEQALGLVDQIATELARLERITPHHFVAEQMQRLADLRLLQRLEELLICPWPTQAVKLVIARTVFSRCYVYPDTIICAFDPTGAEYVAMLAHEGTHILTFQVVNDPELLQKNRQLAYDMPEALAQAVQIRLLEEYGISYDVLLPGKGIHTWEDYVNNTHPMLKQIAPLVYRFVADLSVERPAPLPELYRQVFTDFDQ
jgi:hypothetical protein